MTLAGSGNRSTRSAAGTPRAGPGSNARSPPNRPIGRPAAADRCSPPGRALVAPSSRSGTPTAGRRRRRGPARTSAPRRVDHPARASPGRRRRDRRAGRVGVPCDRTDRPDGALGVGHQRRLISATWPTPDCRPARMCGRPAGASKRFRIAVLGHEPRGCRAAGGAVPGSASRRDRPVGLGQRQQQRFDARRSGWPPPAVISP